MFERRKGLPKRRRTKALQWLRRVKATAGNQFVVPSLGQ